MHFSRQVAPIVVAGAVLAAALSAQTPFKREVDELVRKICGTPPVSEGMTPENAKEAAVLLLALRHCHRHYDREDGRLVREPVKVIYGARGNKGVFGDLETSCWVYQALHDLDAKHYGEDLVALRATIARGLRLKGPRLVQALRPYDAATIGKALPGAVQVRDDFSNLLLLVASQQRAVAKKQKPKPKVRPWHAVQHKGLEYLLSKQQGGKWLVPAGPKGDLVPDPGISALCLAALASKPKDKRTKDENAILNSGVDFLIASQKRSQHGSFSSYVPNYVTCAAIMALSRADTGREDVRVALQKAQKYLLIIQNIEHARVLRSDRDFGSIGYGGDQRGDLSNTQMAIDGLRATGLDVQDEAFAKALIYLRRAQNLPGKEGYRGSTTLEVEGQSKKVRLEPGSDGGAAYYPGNSPAGYDETAGGAYVPRSYGSMTYALLKCYILCGVPKQDARLVAALNWCLSHYTLDENPGTKPSLGDKAKHQGLFYYYLTLARALNLAEVNTVKGRDWRAELRAKLSSLQKADGSWINDKNGRWWEDNPLVCSAYALLALSE